MGSWESGSDPRSPCSHAAPCAMAQGTQEPQEKEPHVPKPPSWGCPWGEEPAVSQDTIPALAVEHRERRPMVSIQRTAVFPALLWPAISRVQSCPPAAPVAPSSSPPQLPGVSKFLKNTKAALAPHSTRARSCSSYQKRPDNTKLIIPNGRGSRGMNSAH